MKNKELSTILAKRINFFLAKYRLTQEKLAYQSGISKGGLSEITRCLQEPSLFTIVKICAGLNISIKQFFDFPEIETFKNLF